MTAATGTTAGPRGSCFRGCRVRSRGMVRPFSQGAHMFAVAGVSGHTGAATAEALLRRGQKVRALVRTEAQGEPWLRRHAEVAVVDLHDSDALAAAMKGLAGAFLLLPPAHGAADVLQTQADMLAQLVSASKKASLKSLCFLSSAGAQHAHGTGPVVSLYRAEKALANAAPSVTFLRSAYFLENWSSVLMQALETGELPFFGHTHLKFAQVGAHDIGEAAAKAMEDHVPGTRFIELAGRELWSAEDVAAVLTSLLDQPIKAVERPVDSAKDSFEKGGMNASTAALYAELYQGMARGLFHFARPPQVLHGTTTLFDSLKPLV